MCSMQSKENLCSEVVSELPAPFPHWGGSSKVPLAPAAAATAKISPQWELDKTSLKAMKPSQVTSMSSTQLESRIKLHFPHQLSVWPYKAPLHFFLYIWWCLKTDAFQNTLHNFLFHTVSLRVHCQPHTRSNPSIAPLQVFTLLKTQMFLSVSMHPLQKLHIYIAIQHIINFHFLDLSGLP